MSILRKKTLLKAAVNMAVVVSFFVSSLCGDTRDAFAVSASPVQVKKELPRLIEKFDVNSFTLPAELGRITYRDEGTLGKTVIHIQDAHCDPAVQKMIRGMLDLFVGRYGVKVVNLEGGAGAYDLSLFTGIPEDGGSRSKVSEYFLKNGIMNGAEFYAINGHGDLKLWGVEDGGLYLENLRVYRKSLSYRDEALSSIEAIGRAVEELKKRMYGPELLGFEEKCRDHSEKRAELGDHINFLFSEAAKKDVPVEQYVNISLLIKTVDIEKKIDFDKANAERDALIGRLKKVMSLKESEELDAALIAYKDGGMTRAGFYGYLLKKSSELGVDVSAPDLSRYGEYVETFNKVDAFESKNEIRRLEDAIRDKMYADPQQIRLGGLSGKLRVLAGLFSLRLTEEDYENFLSFKDTFNVDREISFLAGKAREYGIDAGFTASTNSLAGQIAEMSRFYELSHARNGAFIDNMDLGGAGGVTVLITGGFHAGGMRELLKKKGLGCVSIMPAYSGVSPDPSCYYRLLSGGLDPVSAAVKAAVYNLQVPSIFTRLALEAWGNSDLDSVSAARYIVETVTRTGRSLVVSCDGGRMIRFAMSDGDVVTSAARAPDNGEEVLTIREVMNRVVSSSARKSSGESASDLIGKLFDDDGRILTSVSVAPGEAPRSIRLTNPVGGSRVIDKFGREVGELLLANEAELAPNTIKRGVMLRLRALNASLIRSPDDNDVPAIKVLQGVIDLLGGAELGLLQANEHGVLGASSSRDGKDHIFVSAEFADDPEIMALAVFHEAAGLYLAKHPELVPQGLDIHKFLRGASKKERTGGSGIYRKGVQDELFGELNDEFSYRITRALDAYITEEEARLILAITAYGDSNNDKQKSLMWIVNPNVGSLVITKETAEKFLTMGEEFLREEAVQTRKGSAEISRPILFGKAYEFAVNTAASDPQIAWTFNKGGGVSAFDGLASPRVGGLLRSLKEGSIPLIKPIPSAAKVETDRVIRTARSIRDAGSRNGAIANIPDGKEVIIVGDLHANLKNLKIILSHNGNLAKIRSGEAVLLILGDAVHPDSNFFDYSTAEEKTEKLKEMKSSFETIKFIMRLKRENPENVHYVLGNHDHLGTMVKKGSVFQAEEYENFLAEHFGGEFISAYKEFLKFSPIMARTDDGLVATHAGPISLPNGIKEIAAADVSDETDPIVADAIWVYWKSALGKSETFDEDDVTSFLNRVDGKVMAVGHNIQVLQNGNYYAELMKDKLYVTAGGAFVPGYLSYRNGKMEPVDLSDQKLIAEEETVSPGSLEDEFDAGMEQQNLTDEEKAAKTIKMTKPALTAVDPNAKTLKIVRPSPKDDTLEIGYRLKKLEKRFGEFSVIRTLGEGTFGTVFEVETLDNKRFAIKIAGGTTVNKRKDLYRAMAVMRTADVAFGVIMKEPSRAGEAGYILDIIDAGIFEAEPYVATEVLEGYQKVNSELLSSLDKKGIVSVISGIMRIHAKLKEKGLILFDVKPENFGYKDGNVVLMDMGACAVDVTRASREKVRELMGMGVAISKRHMSDPEVRSGVAERVNKMLDVTPGKKLSKDEVERVLADSQASEAISIMYEAAKSVIVNTRDKGKPVVVFLKQEAGGESRMERLIRELERRLKRGYDVDTLRIMVYNGTQEGFDNAVERAREFLEKPGAKAVVYTAPELYPKDPKPNFIYLKEEGEADVVNVVGPRVALALGMVNYSEGTASNALLNYIEALIKSMVDDTATLEAINKDGLDAFLEDLLKGTVALKMRKIDFDEARKSIIAEEAVLRSL